MMRTLWRRFVRWLQCEKRHRHHFVETSDPWPGCRRCTRCGLRSYLPSWHPSCRCWVICEELRLTITM